MSVVVGNCRKHGSECRCTPGIVTTKLELWAECQGDQHAGERFGLVCCDIEHQFAEEPGDVLGTERRVEDRFPAEQVGHVWVETPICRECCPNHGAGGHKVLTDADKRAITEDFKQWTGGFPPEQADDVARLMYLENTLPTKYRRALVEPWLRGLQP